MATDDQARDRTSFLGTGWSFPPEFVLGTVRGEVRLTSGEEDVEASLRIAFLTRPGERLFDDYGLDPGELLFEPMSVTRRALLVERLRTALLVQEPRIDVLGLQVDSPDPHNGTLQITLSYRIRATNSRYNLVFPFYERDANELRRGPVGPDATTPPGQGG